MLRLTSNLWRVGNLVGSRGRVSTALAIALGVGGLCLAALAVFVYLSWRATPAREKERTGVTKVPPPVEAPRPPRPVPPGLHSVYTQIQRLQRAAQFGEAAEGYPAFLHRLEVAWGQSSEDLASYYYNFALALKLAGRTSECLAAAAKALERWPDDLQLQIIEATTRALEAIRREVFDPRADALYRKFLRPENYARLRGLRLSLPDLYAPWAEMLLLANRVPESLELAEKALSLDARNRKCLIAKGRALLLLQRGREALAIFRKLTLDSPRLRLLAGRAEEQSGHPERAWGYYSELLESPGGDSLPRRAVLQLRLRAATVLNALGRSSEAAPLLAELLADAPDDVSALNQLVLVTRALGRRDATRALNKRVRQLMHRESLLGMASKARSADELASAFYYEALAAAEVHQLGEALARLDHAIRRSPRLGPLYRERARIRLLLGRYRAAEFELRRGIERSGDPYLLADLARVQALRGHRDEMNRTIGRVEALRDREAVNDRDRDRRAVLRLRLARAYLESRNYVPARELLKEPVSSSDAVVERNLCLAELALRRGRVKESRELLAESFHELPGGDAWARALRALLEGDRDVLERDPSDLLDHPRLFLGEAPASLREKGVSLELVRELHARRLEILARMEGYADGDVASGWKELLELYRERGASRKAREVAWFLAHLSSKDASVREQLAGTLTAPEEAVVRFAVLKEAARLSPDSAPVRRELVEVADFLGLKDHALPSK